MPKFSRKSSVYISNKAVERLELRCSLHRTKCSQSHNRPAFSKETQIIQAFWVTRRTAVEMVQAQSEVSQRQMLSAPAPASRDDQSSADRKITRRQDVRIATFVVELLVIAAAAVIVNRLRPGGGLALESIFLVVMAVTGSAFALRGTIASADPHPLADRHCSPKQATIAYFICFMLVVLGVNLVSSGPTIWPLAWMAVSLGWIFAARSAAAASGWGLSSGGVAVYGDPEIGEAVAASLRGSGRCGAVQCVSHCSSEARESLKRMVNAGEIETVVLAGMLSQEHPVAIKMLADMPVGVYLASDYGQTRAPVPDVIEVLPNLLIGSRGLMKRALDIGVAGSGLFVLGPVLMLVALAIRLESKGPAIFRQVRFGVGGRAIEVCKFRTMYSDRGDVTGEQRTLARDPRVTPLGRILRRLSIDEIPQLLNVLKGEMSIVGPRPHSVRMRIGTEFYERAVNAYPIRHRVKPGLTGWAQVNGSRGEVDTLAKAEHRVDLDLWYISNWSISLDVRIILATAFGGFATLGAD
ncbi:sugar transferase [Roseomonas sp. GCM10028921]